MIVYDELIATTLSQFWDKPVITGILRAIADELQEVYTIQQQLRKLTDIDSQEGVNLDNIGDIVGISRADAQGIILRDDAYEMTDDLYRKMLKYKILLNNSAATYYDIINGIKLIWNVNNVTYIEDREKPATYIISLGEHDISEYDALSARTLTIRAAGVKVRYMIAWAIRVRHIWETKIADVIHTNTIPFFGSVRRIDGTLQLNGTYQLDAAVEGSGQIIYDMHPIKHKWNSRIQDIYDVPERLMITPNDNTAWVTMEKPTGAGSVPPQDFPADNGNYIESNNNLSAEFENDGLIISYISDISFEIEYQPTKI